MRPDGVVSAAGRHLLRAGSRPQRAGARAPHPAPLPDWQDLADHPWISYGSGAGDGGEPTALAALHAAVRHHTGRPVERVLDTAGGDLLLMQTGPYLSQLPLDFLERLPGRFLVPLPGRRGAGTVRTAILTRRGEDALPAVRRLREALVAAARA